MVASAWGRIGDTIHEIATGTAPGMRVPARVLADDVLLEAILRDRSVEQLLNVATLPGVVRHVVGMPDMHEGYGFPVGGVAATLLPDGVVSPGGIGFDINCGVRLLATDLSRADLGDRREAFVHELSRSVPTGYGRGGRLLLGDAEMHEVLAHGVPWAIRALGVGEEGDVERIESNGALPGADPAQVSERARQRGHDQLGTLGGGNHFLEVQEVDTIYDEAVAKAFGLYAGQVTVLIHTGSRGLGHQVCTDHVAAMDAALPRFGISLPDRQLACAPLSSPEGRAYLGAMAAAANFAWTNRQVLTHRVREVARRVLGEGTALRIVYDVAHNIAKMEDYPEGRLCVHRKGATRAFGPASAELPARYRGVGQPVFIPGSMGTASFVLVGTDGARDVSFASSCHGAGRTMSRGAARRAVPGHVVRAELEARGIVVRCPSNAELAEEAPSSYKDVERVVDVVCRAGVARRVARLVPLGVLKG
ncbi:MAG: RtcB family protein [Pseudomonadota bacterium]|nr:RtcB family protein [Pseudomonadota bacterium]